MDAGEDLVVIGHAHDLAEHSNISVSVDGPGVTLKSDAVSNGEFRIVVTPTSVGEHTCWFRFVWNGGNVSVPLAFTVRKSLGADKVDEDRPDTVTGALDTLESAITSIWLKRIESVSDFVTESKNQDVVERSTFEEVLMIALEIALTVATEGLGVAAAHSFMHAIKAKSEVIEEMAKVCVAEVYKAGTTLGVSQLIKQGESDGEQEREEKGDPIALSIGGMFARAMKGSLLDQMAKAPPAAKASAARHASDLEAREAGTGYDAILTMAEQLSPVSARAYDEQYKANAPAYANLMARASLGTRKVYQRALHTTDGKGTDLDVHPIVDDGYRDDGPPVMPSEPSKVFDRTPGVLRVDLNRGGPGMDFFVAESWITGFKNDKIVENFGGKTIAELGMNVVARPDSMMFEYFPTPEQPAPSSTYGGSDTLANLFTATRNEAGEYFGTFQAAWLSRNMPAGTSEQQAAQRIFSQIENNKVFPKRTGK